MTSESSYINFAIWHGFKFDDFKSAFKFDPVVSPIYLLTNTIQCTLQRNYCV